jgi:RNA polymerase sigma-70 factor (ECF subfamily)
MAEGTRLRALQGGKTIAEPPTDEQIIVGLCAGQSWAADALYDRVHLVVDRTLRRILQASDSEHEDYMQVSFERIVRTLVQRRFSGACSLSTWASAIATHVGIDALRARVRERRLFGQEADDGNDLPAFGAPSLERQLEARSEVERLQAILAGMKSEQAETVVLHDVLGHELSEIAVLTGVSVAAAQSRLVRGRKELLRRAGLLKWRSK